MLQRAFRLRLQGGQHHQLVRAQAYADGYMRAMIEQGVATETELLSLVTRVRQGLEGAPTRSLVAAGA